MWHVQKFCNDNVLSLPRSSSSSDWFKKFPCGMMNQKHYLIWAVWHIATLTGISVLAPQASFCGESSGGATNCPVVDPGGRGGAGLPQLFWDQIEAKKIFWRLPPPPPPPPPPPLIIWMSWIHYCRQLFFMLEFSEFLHCRCNASISYCILLIKQLGIWVLINFSHLQNRCLFEVGAYLKLGA